MQAIGDRVNAFSESIGRNSKNSQKTYLTSLVHFAEFLRPKSQTPDTIISALQNQHVNVYEILDQFVSYITKRNVSTSSIKLYVAAVRSFLEYFDIDISNSKFKRRVKMPRHFREDEEPIDTEDIRNILLKCNNRRLKAYLLVLASSAMRTIEACALRIRDVDFTATPTKVHIRKEYSKTRRPRDVYITQEATTYLQDLIKWKYRNIKEHKPQPDDLIFSVYFVQHAKPEMIYFRLINEFEKLLEVVGMDQRKDNSARRKITLHSLRRYAKGIVSDQAGSDFSEWLLGHNHSAYWTRKETERRKIYLEKCMPHLTIVDYSALDTRSKNIETVLKEKDKAIEQLTRQMKEMEQHQKEMSDILKHPEKLRELMNS